MATPADHLPTDVPPAPTGAADPRAAARRADALADAYDRLSGYDYVDGPGMATHGPMGAEALSGLGHDDLVAGWVDAYTARHDPIPAPPAADRLDPADPATWRPALGDPARLADWADLFAHQLGDHPWPEVVGAWVPRLLPGYGGAFTHGLLRTAHAVRALEAFPAAGAAPSPLALAELGRGLAYWAGTYLPLPGGPALAGDRSLGAALAAVPRPADAWSPMEAALFARIDELAGFPEAVEALGPPSSASVDDALSDLTSTFARLLLAHPDDYPFGLVHAVTPVAAARTLRPYLPTLPGEQLVAGLWHVDAAIAAGFTRAATSAAIPDTGPDSDPPSVAELVARAAEHRDPHVVKFTEACVREHALRPDPAYLLAARHVADATRPW